MKRLHFFEKRWRGSLKIGACFLALFATSHVTAFAQTVSTFDVLVATETLTVVGTTTLQGNAFSVGNSSFVVNAGSVGIATSAPAGLFSVGNGTITVLASGFVGIGTTTPVGLLDIVAPGTEFQWLGSAGALRAGEGGAEWAPGDIGSYSVAFGFDTSAQGPYSTVAGGFDNLLGPNGSYSIIGNGFSNEVNDLYDFLGGGLGNEIFFGATYSVIAGGYSNHMAGVEGFIGGGESNSISLEAANFSVISGGYDNMITAPFSTIGGGNYNTVSGTGSVVAGGGVLVGGSEAGNTASGVSASVSGGASNEAEGNYSSVPGGFGNVASGLYSFAAGQQSSATAQGSFVWADSENASLTSNTTDEFRIRAGGGYVFLSTPSAATIIVSSGAIMISTSANAANAVPNIFISSTTGRVGVGTALPATILDVNGAVTIRAQETISSTLTVQGNAFSVGGRH